MPFSLRILPFNFHVISDESYSRYNANEIRYCLNSVMDGVAL